MVNQLGNTTSPMEKLTIIVDYSRSIKDLISTGCYDWSNPYITEENFPKNEDEQGKKKLTFKLHNFGEDMTSKDVIYRMDKNGCRPATLRELLAFGEANPRLQEQLPIVALSPLVDYNNNNCFVALWGELNWRELRLDCSERSWYYYCRFLGILET